MRNNLVALFVLVLVSSVTGTVAAQPSREPVIMVAIDAPAARPSVAPHLTDEAMALRAPDSGDYVLPILGVVLGGAATLTGLVGVLGSAFVLALHEGSGPTNAGAWLGGSAALAAVGAVTLGFSIAELRNLHHRANDAEETGVQVIQFAPSASGGVLSVAGTF
jgi:hypothetical protein